MTRSSTYPRRSVYLVCFHKRYRERMLATLEPQFGKMTVVTLDGTEASAGGQVIRPRPNPTGILRMVGLGSLKKRIDRYLHFPSAHNLATAAAKPVLKRLIGDDLRAGFRVCLIQATPPHGITTLGLYLKRTFPSIRWLVDWQDLWTFDDVYRERVPAAYQSRLKRLEKTILGACDLNITTNPKAADVLNTRYGVPRDRLASIGHPYDPKDRAAIRHDAEVRPDRQRPITIGFLGRLSKPPKVPGKRVLEAVADAAGQGLDLELHIFGDKSEITRQTIAALASDRIVLHERVAHVEALNRIARCDFLLITLADLENCNIIMHAKWPHYLILNRPVIAMVPSESFIAEAVRKTRSGVVIDTGSDWGKELARVVREYGNGEFEFNPNAEEIARYSWDFVSGLWLDAITETDTERT